MHLSRLLLRRSNRSLRNCRSSAHFLVTNCVLFKLFNKKWLTYAYHCTVPVYDADIRSGSKMSFAVSVWPRYVEQQKIRSSFSESMLGSSGDSIGYWYYSREQRDQCGIPSIFFFVSNWHRPPTSSGFLQISACDNSLITYIFILVAPWISRSYNDKFNFRNANKVTQRQILFKSFLCFYDFFFFFKIPALGAWPKKVECSLLGRMERW